MRSGETTLNVAGRARVRGPGGILLLCVGALALWVVLMFPNAFAQEPSQEPGPAPSGQAPVEEVTSPQPQEIRQEPNSAPSAPAPVEEVTSPQPQETRQEPSPPPVTPPPAKELTIKNVLLDISGLVMQPVFLVIKLPVAVIGGVVGGVLWPFGGENHEGAQQVWNATVAPPWNWPDFVRGLGGKSPPPQ